MSAENEFMQLEEDIVEALRTVYDPEIPVNIYDLGLIYRIDIDSKKLVTIDMTFTAPSCPMADYIVEDVQIKMLGVQGVRSVKVNLVFEPAWDKDMMSDEAKLELGLL
ncbi:MAG: iron-sulfur cluster assembly protein [Tannerellaceae bacterium]|jgi:FeS assembly SUF system protein|nr:iron-sulfur cluster assembly protein [Tannerellaceae bacterium]